MWHSCSTLAQAAASVRGSAAPGAGRRGGWLRRWCGRDPGTHPAIPCAVGRSCNVGCRSREHIYIGCCTSARCGTCTRDGTGQCHSSGIGGGCGDGRHRIRHSAAARAGSSKPASAAGVRWAGRSPMCSWKSQMYIYFIVKTCTVLKVAARLRIANPDLCNVGSLGGKWHWSNRALQNTGRGTASCKETYHVKHASQQRGLWQCSLSICSACCRVPVPCSP